MSDIWQVMSFLVNIGIKLDEFNSSIIYTLHSSRNFGLFCNTRIYSQSYWRLGLHNNGVFHCNNIIFNWIWRCCTIKWLRKVNCFHPREGEQGLSRLTNQLSFTKDPPKKWSSDWKTFETPERVNYSAPVFYTYRVFGQYKIIYRTIQANISVYIWTVVGLAWSGGVLSILVNIQKLKTMNDELKAQTRKVSTDQVYINSSLNSECKIAFQSRTNLSTF